MELISLNLRLKNWFGCKFTIHPFAGKRSDIRSADRWEWANPVEQGAPPLLSSITGWEAGSRQTWTHLSLPKICLFLFGAYLLSNTCSLVAKSGIKKHLTPILAGLLEVNPQKMWTFEKFFNEVRQSPFLETRDIHTVCRWQICWGRRRCMCTTLTSWVNCGSTSTALRYLPVYSLYQSISSITHLSTNSHLSAQHLEHLQLLLTEQTDVEPGSQILLLNVIFHV